MSSYQDIALTILLGSVLLMSPGGTAGGETGKAEHNRLRLYVVFNNLPYRAGMESSWGFSCLVETPGRTLLFDTGADGEILLANLRRLGLDAEAVDAVVLSHLHGDHTGGLGAFLSRNPDVTVFMPASFPASFRHEVLRFGAAIETVSTPRPLTDGVYSTGELGRTSKEQALIVDTAKGLIVITGCAHPNVADMAGRARDYLGKNIYLLIGGFHLGGKSDAEIQALIGRLKALGVAKVAPSHCTGANAIRLFRDAWGDDFVEGGLGAVIEVPTH